MDNRRRRSVISAEWTDIQASGSAWNGGINRANTMEHFKAKSISKRRTHSADPLFDRRESLEDIRSPKRFNDNTSNHPKKNINRNRSIILSSVSHSSLLSKQMFDCSLGKEYSDYRIELSSLLRIDLSCQWVDRFDDENEEIYENLRQIKELNLRQNLLE